MADKKTGSSTSPLSDDPANPTNGGLSAKPKTASHPAGAEPDLDTRFHRTSRDSAARPALRQARSASDRRFGVSSNGLLGGSPRSESRLSGQMFSLLQDSQEVLAAHLSKFLLGPAASGEFDEQVRITRNILQSLDDCRIAVEI